MPKKEKKERKERKETNDFQKLEKIIMDFYKKKGDGEEIVKKIHEIVEAVRPQSESLSDISEMDVCIPPTIVIDTSDICNMADFDNEVEEFLADKDDYKNMEMTDEIADAWLNEDAAPVAPVAPVVEVDSDDDDVEDVDVTEDDDDHEIRTKQIQDLYKMSAVSDKKCIYLDSKMSHPILVDVKFFDKKRKLKSKFNCEFMGIKLEAKVYQSDTCDRLSDMILETESLESAILYRIKNPPKEVRLKEYQERTGHVVLEKKQKERDARHEAECNFNDRKHPMPNAKVKLSATNTAEMMTNWAVSEETDDEFCARVKRNAILRAKGLL
jgi:hypothetical protein